MTEVPASPVASPPADRRQFYVEADCCMLCGVPEGIAPELFETGEASCWVKRQPRTPTEVDAAIRVMWAGEVDCVRYSGADEQILRRVGEAGLADQADSPAARGHRTIVRDRVTFAMPPGLDDPRRLAGMFAAEQRRKHRKVVPRFPGSRTVWFSWFRWRFHGVRFEAAADEGQLLVTLLSGALPGLAWAVDDWLRAQGATSVVWHAGSQGAPGADSRPTPM
jgi:hypothetical protein